MGYHSPQLAVRSLAGPPAHRNQIMKNYSKTIRMGSMFLTLLFAGSVLAASADKLNRESDKALEIFRDDINGAQIFLDQAAGYLVFPRVIKVGVGIGAETGEGVLRVGGQTIAYYRTTAGSIGLQLGAQAKSIVIAFMTKASLQKFRDSNGWKVGVDGSVALIDLGAGKTIDSQNIKDPVVGFIFGSKGLMYNLTLEGSKFSKLEKS
jgi:lipid-binding SYLF domain-containing protein